MPAIRRAVAACLITLALSVPALAEGPVDPGMGPARAVYADYFVDGVIDEEHSAAALLTALEQKQGDAQYADFAGAVESALEHHVLGVRSTGPDDRGDGLAGAVKDNTPPPGSRQSFERESQAATPLLPAPGPADQRGRPPWPFLALSAAAAALVITGAGSGAYRRLRRRGEPPAG